MTERDELLQALDAALAALENGASLESVLAADPARAPALRPLLMAALSAGAGRDLPRVPAGAQAASRAQFLAAAAGRRPALALAPAAGRWARLRAWLFGRSAAGSSLLTRAAAVGLVVLAGLSVGGYGAVAASAQSLPGDALYGVKRTVESTQLLLATDPQSRAQLQKEFDDRRVHEAQAVAGAGRQVAVEFTGTLISINVINGSQTQQWMVSGVVVSVGPQVPVAGTPVVGGHVHIQGIVQTAGQVQAQRVTVLPDDATPTATATASSTLPAPATATPSEIATTPFAPVVSSTPAPTFEAPAATLEPSASPPPSATLAPAATDDHGGGPGSSASNTPDATAAATQAGGEDHGGASATPAATDDHSGGASPTPAATDDHGGQASATPQPTQSGGSDTPEPTDSSGDHGGGGGPSPSNTPQPTNSGGGGGPSPSNTPRPTDSGGGSSPSNTPKPDN